MLVRSQAETHLSHRAFTLVEMCLVLVVMGIIIQIVYPALMAMKQANQRSLTDENLRALLRATAVYVQANGCLPCPTPVSTSDSGFGYVRGDSSASRAACGVCSVAEGLPPFASLGVPVAVAHDGWGRWVRMRVDPALTIAFGVVPPTAACTATDGCTVGTSAKGLCKTGLSSTNRISVVTPPTMTTQKAAVLFISHGVDGYGALYTKTISDGSDVYQYPFPSSVLACANGGYARCNANDEGATTRPSFVNATPVISTTVPYDDIMVYLDRNNLVSYLGNGSCQTVW